MRAPQTANASSSCRTFPVCSPADGMDAAKLYQLCDWRKEHDCLWHLADMTTVFGDVRFRGQSGRAAAMSANDRKQSRDPSSQFSYERKMFGLIPSPHHGRP